MFHARRVPHWYVSTKVPLLDASGGVVGIAGAMYGVEQPDERHQFFQELSPIIEYIERHFAEPITMCRMAELAGLSSTHFNRRFQHLLRMTPTYYLRIIRIQAGRRLLSTTQKSLADIAVATNAGQRSPRMSG